MAMEMSTATLILVLVEETVPQQTKNSLCRQRASAALVITAALEIISQYSITNKTVCTQMAPLVTIFNKQLLLLLVVIEERLTTISTTKIIAS